MDARLAALYDRLHPPEQRDDFRFYVPLILGAGSVLDVGCGTGALLRLARAAGHAGRLVGLDPAPGMLAVARSQPDIEWVLGDLGSVAFDDDDDDDGGGGGEFDLIVMTGNAFQVFLGDDEISHVLAAVRAVLRPGGRFVFETRNPLVREWETWTTRDPVEATDGEGTVVRMTCEVDNPDDDDLIRFTLTYSSPAWEQPVTSSSTLRFVGRDALTQFLVGAGLEIEEQFGDFKGGARSDVSPTIVTIATRSGT